MENNGKASNGKRTKHINIRYLFVTARIKKKEVSVDWCPTNDMTGDFFIKLNQGALYRKVQRHDHGGCRATRLKAWKV